MVTNLVQFLHTTMAYQSAALQLMAGEANYAVKQLDLKESLPICVAQNSNEWIVSSPAMGVSGSVLSSNYSFEFRKGQLTGVRKIEWLKKVFPPITNLVELADRPMFLNTNIAHQLATQWLARMSVDVGALEGRYSPKVFQVSVKKTSPDGSYLPGPSDTIATPLFKISWGDRFPPFDLMSPVHMEILGTTMELLTLSIHDPSFFKGPPLTVTNAADLLGPLPPPRYFVEQLVGGKEAYETIAKPELVQIWLLNTYETDGQQMKKTDRAGPVALKPKAAGHFSDPLLDFDSYAWTVGKMCSPDYGVRLRFTRGKDSVEFRLCYECDILEVTHDGRTQSENFDYGHNKLVHALQSVFPKDNIVMRLELNGKKPEDLLKMLQRL